MWSFEILKKTSTNKSTFLQFCDRWSAVSFISIQVCCIHLYFYLLNYFTSYCSTYCWYCISRGSFSTFNFSPRSYLFYHSSSFFIVLKVFSCKNNIINKKNKISSTHFFKRKWTARTSSCSKMAQSWSELWAHSGWVELFVAALIIFITTSAILFIPSKKNEGEDANGNTREDKSGENSTPPESDETKNKLPRQYRRVTTSLFGKDLFWF